MKDGGRAVREGRGHSGIGGILNVLLHNKVPVLDKN